MKYSDEQETQTSRFRDLLLRYHTNWNAHPVAEAEEAPDSLIVERHNPQCGDTVRLSAADGKSSSLEAFCRGCSICTGSADFTVRLLRNRKWTEIETIAREARAIIRGEQQSSETALLKDEERAELSLFSVLAEYPSRQACALLVWDALDELIASKDLH